MRWYTRRTRSPERSEREGRLPLMLVESAEDVARTATEQQVFGRLALTRLEDGAAGLVSNADDLAGPDPAIAAKRRLELEEQALAEIRLTDSGERGQPART